MKKAHYLPKGDRPRDGWFTNFNKKFTDEGAKFGFTPEEIADVNKDCLAFKYAIDDIELFKTELHERTSYKDVLADGELGTPLGSYPAVPSVAVAPAAVPAGIFKRIAKIVQRIKNHPSYNESVGQNFGIIGAEKVLDLDTVKTSITVKNITPEKISLEFVKGDMEGVAVFAGTPVLQANENGGTTPTATETDTEAGMNWVEIARVSHSPFVDTRLNVANKPEIRYYKMRYIKKDTFVGQMSDIVQVVAEIYKGGIDLANVVK